MTERDFAIDIVQRLQNANYQALWAGGCVRDELLGLTPADYDIATDATPEQVQSLFKRTIGIGASFGVIEVLGPRDEQGQWLKVQVATFRCDGTYSDERRPDSVMFSSPREDAERRDFTINGMFRDPIANRVIDYVGGEADLKAKVLRAIGVPEKRFEEDKLRILRAVRMAARFELDIDPRTADAARAMAHRITIVSAERIAEELRKILVHPNRARGVRLLQELNLIEPILPELAGRTDDAFAAIDALTSCISPFSPGGEGLGVRGGSLPSRIQCFSGVEPSPSPPTPLPQGRREKEILQSKVSFPLAFAVLLHQVVETTPNIGERLRLSNAERDRIAWLHSHEPMLHGQLQPSILYPLLVHPGHRELLELHRALAGKAETIRHCEELLATKSPEELNPPPLLNGNDLQALGLKPGPQFKRILDAVRAGQLDGQLRSIAEAEAFAQHWH